MCYWVGNHLSETYLFASLRKRLENNGRVQEVDDSKEEATRRKIFISSLQSEKICKENFSEHWKGFNAIRFINNDSWNFISF